MVYLMGMPPQEDSIPIIFQTFDKQINNLAICLYNAGASLTAR